MHFTPCHESREYDAFCAAVALNVPCRVSFYYLNHDPPAGLCFYDVSPLGFPAGGLWVPYLGTCTLFGVLTGDESLHTRATLLKAGLFLRNASPSQHLDVFFGLVTMYNTFAQGALQQVMATCWPALVAKHHKHKMPH